MKVSLCITTFNEEKTIVKLLDSIFTQTKKLDEVVIIDAGSLDTTASLIKKYQRKNKRIRLMVSKGASIAKGRNIAIKNAKYPIITMTDAGCILEKNWLERITVPFENGNIDVVAGFYEMTGKSDFQEALKPFLGIMPDKFSEKTFLPSTRSIAFRKPVWKKVHGFNEKFDRAGEDTYFNFEILKNNFKIVREKNGRVNWEVPKTFGIAMKKFFYYSRGDAQSGRLSKHNIKVLTIFLRYILFLIFWPLFLIYICWVISKHRKYTKNWRQRIYTAIIQLGSDFAVMLGFISGM